MSRQCRSFIIIIIITNWRCSTCCRWHAPRYRTWPSTQDYLLKLVEPLFLLQAQSWKTTTSLLCKWLDLAFTDQGWNSICQGRNHKVWPHQTREATGWIEINPAAWRMQHHLGRHCHQHRRCIIRGNYFCPSHRIAQRNQICWNSANSPVSIRDNGPHQCRWTMSYISDLVHRISWVTDDLQDTSFLFQRISVDIQRFNAGIFKNSFCHTDDSTACLPKHTYNLIFYNNFLNFFALGNWVSRAIIIIIIIMIQSFRHISTLPIKKHGASLDALSLIRHKGAHPSDDDVTQTKRHQLGWCIVVDVVEIHDIFDEDGSHYHSLATAYCTVPMMRAERTQRRRLLTYKYLSSLQLSIYHLRPTTSTCFSGNTTFEYCGICHFKKIIQE